MDGFVSEDDFLKQLSGEVEKRQARVNELEQGLGEAKAELRRYSHALASLRGEPRGPGGRPAKRSKRSRAFKGSSGSMGEERLSEIAEMVRAYAEDHEEFRQTDIRAANPTHANGSVLSSGQVAIAFDILRQQNVIRLARAEKGSKYFRLTRQALHGR